MRKVAVFGNAGGGKSTLARRLAGVTGLSLYPIDTIKFRAGGSEIPHQEYLKIPSDLLNRDQWIIDGLAVSRRHGSGSLQLIRSFTLTCPFLLISDG